MKIRPHTLILLLGIIFMAVNCSAPHADKETLLVRVGEKTISKNEFIRRAEYTIRPAYCRRDNYIHRKIILNSLIAEKLLALEAGENLPILENKRFQAYMRGRKEQAMRQLLYHDAFYQRTKVASRDTRERMDLVSRRYSIEYVSLEDSADIGDGNLPNGRQS